MANRSKNISPTIGDKIKELRISADCTQKDLAIFLNKAESTVRMWELGKSEPDLETVKLIAKHFSVTTDFLLGMTDEISRFRHTSGRLNAAMRTARITASDLVAEFEKIGYKCSRLQLAAFLDGRAAPDDYFIENFAKILEINPDALYANTSAPLQITFEEETLLAAYRSQPEMQKPITMLLRIPTEPNSTNDITDAVSDIENNSEKWKKFLNDAADPRQTDSRSDLYRAARSTDYHTNDLESTNEEDEDDTFTPV